MSMFFEIDAIIAGATPKDVSTSGIYLLINDGAVVYVGQSRNLPARLYDHITKGKMRFTAYFAIPCTRRDLSALEGHYIAKFRPRYNKTMRWDRLEIPVDRLRGGAKKAALRQRAEHYQYKFRKTGYWRRFERILERFETVI